MLKLDRPRVYIGRNIHCDYPAVAVRIVIEAQPHPDFLRNLGTIKARLCRVLADIAQSEPFVALDGPDGKAGTHATVGLLVAWLAAELQNFADGDIESFGVDENGSQLTALCGYQIPALGIEAMQTSGLILSQLLPLPPEAAAVAEMSGRLRNVISRLVASGRSGHLDQTTRALVAAARARNIPHYRISSRSRFIQLGQGVKQRHLLETVTDRIAATAANMTTDKSLTNLMLRRLGLPVPPQALVQTVEQAEGFAQQVGYPVVVKPVRGGQGRGVTVGIASAEELRPAIERAARSPEAAVLIEKFIPGDDHRLLVVGGKLIAAARRIPGHVVGDGRHSIEQLIAIVNEDLKRGTGFGRELVKLAVDNEARRMIARKGYALSHVPAAGELVQLRGTANISTGGTAVDVTDIVHPEVREMAELAARAFKLEIAGVDYLSEDISRSYRDIGGAICEVNSCPGLRPHWSAGTDRARLSHAILDLHFPPGDNGRIPIVALTGTSGKTTTARMVCAMLQASGLTTALACTDGITVGARHVRDGDCAGGEVCRSMLFDPSVEAAVMELARGGLIKSGVPIDTCDVAALLNVTFDHVGQDGVSSLEELAAVKAMLLQVASRYIVLNADNDQCARMAGRTHSAPICWFAEEAANPVVAAHVAGGGLAVTLKGAGAGAEIVVHHGDRDMQVVTSLVDIPCTWRGKLVANVRNALAAAAIGYVLGVSVAHIRAALKGFQIDLERNPGRFNLLQGRRFRLLVDCAAAPADMVMLRCAVHAVPVKGRRILAFTAPGNRVDAHFTQLAEAAAGFFDHYICYSWNNLRGRRIEEVPALLAAGLEKCGVAREQIAVIPAQDAAIEYAASRAGPDDLLILVVLDAPAILRRIVEKVVAS